MWGVVTAIVEAIKAVGQHYPAVLTAVGALSVVAFILRGFSYKEFHYAGWADLWRRNGDRDPHYYAVENRKINPSARRLLKLERKWRKNIMAVIQDPAHDEIKVDFLGNEFVSLEYARMWRRLIGILHKGCCFKFRVLDGTGQQPLVDELNGSINDYVESLIKARADYQTPPIRVISEVVEYDAPNARLVELLDHDLFKEAT